ncbi:MAG: DUF3352 domain-containing protein, partial [Leptolyngbya sp. SIO1D8]|nr:DUF3352 domain-containing protein [Leptolyngbya sp. SIO1D8]
GLPAGVRAVPEDAVAVLSLSTNPEQWQRFRQFGSPETQTSFDQQLADWRDRWLTRYDISFYQDVQPWVGPEVTLAWLPEAVTTPEAEADIVLGNQRRILLLPIADPETAQISAESLPLTTETTSEPVEYRGVKLSAYLPASGEVDQALWVGVLGTQLILVAEDETTAQQAIDAYKGGQSLADIAGYRRSFEEIRTAQAFGKLYFNVSAVSQLIAQAAQPALPTVLLESFQDSQGLAATVSMASQGVKIKSTSWLAPNSDRTYVASAAAPQLPDYLPQDTLVMASGGNFKQFWQDLSERRTWGALTAFEPENLALAFQGSTGLALENDLLPWMSGEFAMALVPPQSTPSEEDDNGESLANLPDPGLVALVQVSDRTQAEQTFSQLDTVVKNRYRFSIVNEPSQEMELVKWISPFQSVNLSRGWLDSSVAFLTVGADTEAAIVPKPRRSLAKAPLFQLTTADAPAVNNGYFYLNLEALNQTNNNLFLPALPVENQGALRAIQGLGVTATILDEQQIRYDLYIALKRGNRPGPLPSASPRNATEEPTEEGSAVEETPASAALSEAESPSETETSIPEDAATNPPETETEGAEE